MSTAVSRAPTPELAFNTLTAWYAAHARPLPWRKEGTTPWGVLVCEVMSQQTPVARVAPVWIHWMNQWPTPIKMSDASPAEVLIAWNRLGYPRRALRLLECACEIVARFAGKVPSDRESLLSLPGIGPYTAEAIRAFAYGAYSVVLDTNIRRVLARWHGSSLPAPHQTKTELERATRYVPNKPEYAAQWNASIMEFGALICTANTPHCTQCPVAEHCEWKAAGYPIDTYAAARSPQKFSGTHREARGKIMAILRNAASHTRTEQTSIRDSISPSEPIFVTRYELSKASKLPDERFIPALASLIDDGLVAITHHRYHLPTDTSPAQASPTQNRTEKPIPAHTVAT